MKEDSPFFCEKKGAFFSLPARVLSPRSGIQQLGDSMVLLLLPYEEKGTLPASSDSRVYAFPMKCVPRRAGERGGRGLPPFFMRGRVRVFF